MTTSPKSFGSGIFRLEPVSTSELKIWKLVFDLPGEKVNKLSKKVMEEFETLVLPALEANAAAVSESGVNETGGSDSRGSQFKIDALILNSGKPNNFIAGADIDMILATKNSAEAQELSSQGHRAMNRWEDLPFPTISAIDGSCLGGGCELALASTAMVMSDNQGAKIGLPEVNLGVIPGSGGCVRLPRKVGIATALDLILTGKTLNGVRAYKAGLTEAVIPKEDFEGSVVKWVSQNIKALRAGYRIAKDPVLGGVGGPIGAAMEKTIVGRSIIYKKAREGVMSKSHGNYPSPLEAIDVLKSNGSRFGMKIRGDARDRAMAREAEGFGKMAATDVSKNLIGLFFLTEGVKKSKGLPTGVVAEAHPVHNLAVLGAGVMGGGIAQLAADKNLPVRMKDITVQSLSAGIQAATRVFLSQVKKKKINKREYVQKLNHIAPVLDYSGFKNADVVVEAIVENMGVKKKAFQELEGQIKDTCIVASNTSSLSVSEMQTAFKKPERFVGMHFFNPVHRMPLVEVIRGKLSSNEAVTTIFQLSKQMGKTPIVVKDSPGFLVNRILASYMGEAAYLVAEEAPIPELDRALVEFGMPMGPVELIDEVGIDVADKVGHIFEEAFGERMKASPLSGTVLKSGRLGKKNGKGFYQYAEGGRNKTFDPSIYEVVGVKPVSGKFSAQEMIERCVYSMINEAAMCLDEEVVSSAAEVDLGMIMGTGFPPFRGGLLKYADTVGAAQVVEALRGYEKKLGLRFAPSQALLKRAEQNRPFYEKNSKE